MRLHDLIHAHTRPAWTVRLLAYVAVVATLVFIVQVLHLWVL